MYPRSLSIFINTDHFSSFCSLATAYSLISRGTEADTGKEPHPGGHAIEEQESY